MHAFKRAETTQLKSFLSRTHERYRPPYAMVEVDEPRQVVFIGNSNQDTYLRDETGGRRFWPVKTGDIRIDELRTDRNQLLAEAVHAFKAGRNWWPDKDFEKQHFEPEQEKRYEFDEWLNPIAGYLYGMTETTIQKIAAGALELKKDRLGLFEQKRIAAILRKLGWVATRTKHSRSWRSPALWPPVDAPPPPPLSEAMRDVSPDDGAGWR
jgi:predicted P-loop ATPase